MRSVEYGELRGVGQYPSYWVIVKGENRGRPVIVRLWTYVGSSINGYNDYFKNAQVPQIYYAIYWR